ncbi:unnamed protein product, partial [Prunus brigantina]
LLWSGQKSRSFIRIISLTLSPTDRRKSISTFAPSVLLPNAALTLERNFGEK